MLSYLNANQTDVDRLRERMQKDAGLAKIRAYLDKVMVLAPKRWSPYASAAGIHGFLRDADALQQLSRRIESANLDMAESTDTTLKFYRYEDEPDAEQERIANMALAESLVSECREGAKGPALAFAIGHLQGLKMLAPDWMSIDTDEIVQLAEEAHAAAPSSATTSNLIAVLLFRANQALAGDDPDYAETATRVHRSLGATYLIPLLLARDDELGETARENADVKRAIKLIVKRTETFSAAQVPWAWAILRNTHPEQAAKVAKYVEQDEVGRLGRTITRQLSPVNANSIYDIYWAKLAAGDETGAKELLKQAANLGIPIPQSLDDTKPTTPTEKKP